MRGKPLGAFAIGALLAAAPAAARAQTVADAATSSCTTTSVKGLAEQIVAQAVCLSPGAYVAVPSRPNLSLGAAVFPYLEQPARDALVAALDAHSGTTMSVNSMLRTVVQQYLLYDWYLAGTCGIGLAAKPGKSNHETGLALDVSEHATWQAALEAEGFVWLGTSDPVHFDYAGPGAVDYKGTDVLAFQKLWNKNHPTDPLVEDGLYGPQTEGRLVQAPAAGFALGPSCDPGTGGQGGASGGGGAPPGGGGAGGVAATGGAGGGEAGGAQPTGGGGAAPIGGATGGGGAGAGTGAGEASGCNCSVPGGLGDDRAGRGVAAALLALLSLLRPLARGPRVKTRKA